MAARGERARETGHAKQHRTVSRVTTILETVAADPRGVRLSALAEVLDAPKTSVHGLVKGLVATGYLREQQGCYLLGPAVGALLSSPDAQLAAAAHPQMQRLRDRFDETVMLAVLVGDSVVYLDSLESGQLIRYSAPLRTRRPVYPTSTGKCLLAHQPTARRDAYLDEHVDPADRERVRRELDEIAAEGVSRNRGETVPDVTAMAGIVLARRATASVAIAGPTERVSAHLDAMAGEVRETCARIARDLGS
ncbi:IclR family transcriptional regulator [Saccharopolyspora sp. HNM0983]|uniref:IclR family transcriptional regulator n=1 Tax=Saccharopolyspora montiporae TaxID=2781240 RepID=A0A929B9R6_9PSEU|nr:IclR family transcriptional regulator [Saccharopolyspora sp. HNM0983]